MLIYKITNLVNGKIYIGQDSLDRYDINEYAGSGIKIKRAIAKYGISNFKKEILEIVNENTNTFEREDYWVEKLGARDANVGYNIAKPAKAFFTGCTHTAEWKINASVVQKEIQNRPDIKEKRIAAFKIAVNQPGLKEKRIKVQTEAQNRPDVREKRHQSLLEAQNRPGTKERRYKKIYSYSLNGNFIKEYASMTSASIELSIPLSNIIATCKGKILQAKGIIFTYKKLDEGEIKSHVDKINNLQNRPKKIQQCDLNGDVIKEYASITKAAKEFKGYRSLLMSCLCGERKTAYGYKWRFVV